MIDWTPFAPTDNDVQESQRTETAACVPFSAIHIIEMLVKQRSGQEIDLSERALAKFSGTLPTGNSFTNVFAALNNHPLLLEQDWPIPDDDYTWDEFYQPVPFNLTGSNFRFQMTPVPFSKIPEYLNYAPLWTEIRLSPTVTHAVALLTPTTYFDSYGKLIKPLTQPIINCYLLTFMSNAKLVKKGNEFGIYLGAGANTPELGEQVLINLCNNVGYPIPTLNNGANVDWANLKPDITINS